MLNTRNSTLQNSQNTGRIIWQNIVERYITRKTFKTIE